MLWPVGSIIQSMNKIIVVEKPVFTSLVDDVEDVGTDAFYIVISRVAALETQKSILAIVNK